MQPNQLLAEAGEFIELQTEAIELRIALDGMLGLLVAQRVTEPWLGEGNVWKYEKAGHESIKRSLLPDNFREIMKGGKTLPFVDLDFQYMYFEHSNTIAAWHLYLAGGLVNANGALFNRTFESVNLQEAKSATLINKSESHRLSDRRKLIEVSLAEISVAQSTLDAFPVIARPFDEHGDSGSQFYLDIQKTRSRPKPGKVVGQIPDFR